MLTLDETVTPLIIVGRQRSGTRFLANALNRFPGVTVQGELPNPVMASFQKFIDKTDNYYRRMRANGMEAHRRQYAFWKEKKRDLIFSCWTNASQSRVSVPRENCRYFGYKRPNNEFYFEFYERHLSERPPIYIYCTRNFQDNYLSIASRWPNRGIHRVAREYLESSRQYWKMKAVAPDRVLGFVLDDYIEQGADYLCTAVLDRLGLDYNDEHLERIQSQGKSNSTESKNIPRRTSLTKRESVYLRLRPALAENFQAIRRRVQEDAPRDPRKRTA
jgi:hypothetical protein